MEKGESKYVANDEISLKELILKIQDFSKELIRNWLIIIIIIIPFIVFMLYQAVSTPVSYSANLTFMLNEDDGGGLGALGGLAASFGLGGSKGEFNIEKMIALSKSRNIIQQSLFEKIKIEGKTDFIANHIIDEYKLLDELKEKDLLDGFEHFEHDSLSEFSRIENSILQMLHGNIIGTQNKKGLLSSYLDEDTGIVNLNISAKKESLSIELVNIIFEKLSHFYINKSIEQQKNTFLLTKQKTDSLRTTLNNVQYRLLKFKDTHRNLSLRQFESEELKLERDAQILAMAYGEALKNQEIADFTLRSKTPFIQSIDLPIAPIAPVHQSKIKAIIFGGIIGLFISIILILGRKIYTDALSS